MSDNDDRLLLLSRRYSDNAGAGADAWRGRNAGPRFMRELHALYRSMSHTSVRGAIRDGRSQVHFVLDYRVARQHS